MQAARPKPALGNLEAAPFSEEHVVSRYPYVLEGLGCIGHLLTRCYVALYIP